MKTIEKELTRENLTSYNKNGFITREKVVSKMQSEIISESKFISKNYHKINWNKIFEDVHIRFDNTDKDFINYILINDKDLGMFSIRDMGENYIIFCKPTWTEEDKTGLVNRLKKYGIICEILNKNLFSIKKQLK